MLRCLVRCSTGESRRLRPRQTAKRSVEARRVALRAPLCAPKNRCRVRSKEQPQPRGATIGDATFGHRPKARGPFGSNNKVFCRHGNRSDRRLVKTGEDQGANGEVEDSKEIQQESTAEPCEELRRKASGSERAGRREGQIHQMMTCVWAQWAVGARM